jgi:hypothetical protein
MAIYTLTAAQLRGAGISNSFVIPSSSTPPTPTFDADAQAFIRAAAITDTTQQTAINNLVVSMKGYGIWTKMKALYPMVGGTAAQHKFNLKNPLDTDAAFRLTFNGGWTHSSTGALPNGTNAYADTKLNTLNNLTKTSTHLSTYLRNNPIPGQNYDMGNSSDNFGYFDVTVIISRYNNNTAYFTVAEEFTSAASIASTDSIGFWNNTTNGSSTKRLFKNGSLITTHVATNGTFANNALYLAACNTNNTAQFFSNKETAFSSIGDGLTDTEAANYYTAVQTFQTTLGRQVGVPIVSDSDAQAFLNAAVITDTTQATAVNTLVTDLKGYGVWTKMKALYPFVGGTATQHKFNLKDPRDLDAAFRLTFNGGWVHSSTGAKPNGTNAYANSFFNPSLHNIANSSHMSFYSRTTYVDSATAAAEMGCYTAGGAQRNLILASGNGTSYCVPNNNNEFIVSFLSNGVGFYLASRTSSTAIMGQRNSTQYTNTATTFRINNIISLGAGSGPTPGSYSSYSPRESAFASIGDGLTSTEAANYYTAVQAFQTTLSRQV